MLKQTLAKANALNDEREELEKKIKALEEWTAGLKSGNVNPPNYSYYQNAGRTINVQIDSACFILLVQIERTECQARLAQVMEEFSELQDPAQISEVEFEEEGSHE